MNNPTILHLVFDPILDVIFRLSMKILMVFRKKGSFGTPDKPIYLTKGDNVPHWLQMRSPWLKMEISCECETYYDSKLESQVVRPLYNGSDYVIRVDSKWKYPVFNDGIVVGAKTLIDRTPRPKTPVMVEKVDYSQVYSLRGVRP